MNAGSPGFGVFFSLEDKMTFHGTIQPWLYKRRTISGQNIAHFVRLEKKITNEPLRSRKSRLLSNESNDSVNQEKSRVRPKSSSVLSYIRYIYLTSNNFIQIRVHVEFILGKLGYSPSQNAIYSCWCCPF